MIRALLLGIGFAAGVTVCVTVLFLGLLWVLSRLEDS